MSQISGCTNESFVLIPSSASFPYTGGSGYFSWYKTAGMSNCASQAVSTVSWIILGPNLSATSSGRADYVVAQGTMSARTGIVNVASLGGLADRTSFLVVQAGAQDPIITTDYELPAARQGVPYSVQLTATSAIGPVAPVVWSVAPGSLPPGLSLSFSGLLSGTPFASGAFTICVGANLPGSFYIAQRCFILNVLSSGPNGFYSLAPCRIVDTRVGSGKAGPFGPPFLSGGTTRPVPISGYPNPDCPVPANATAFSLNVTVVPHGPMPFLSIWPSGQARPLVSTLNAFGGEVVANAAIVPSGANGWINLYASDETDVIIDINGYFAPPTVASLEFYPVKPCRVADTRTGSGFTGAFGSPTMLGGSTRDFPVPQSGCGIPPWARAYALNMTVVPQGTLGFLSTWPSGSAQPLVSTLNSFDGRIVANAAIVPASANGAISVFVSDPSDVVIDINGYFAAPGSAGALNFYLLPPCRIADTRVGSGITGPFGPPVLAAGASRDFPITGSSCGVPLSAQAYSLNMTVVPPGPLYFLSVWPALQTQPLVSTLNSFQGKILANAALVLAGANGAVSVFVTNPADLIIDINGYFAP